MSFQMGGGGALAAVASSSHHGGIQQQQQEGTNSYVDEGVRLVNGYGYGRAPGASLFNSGGVGGGVQTKSDPSAPGGQQQQQPVHSFQLPVHTMQPQMPSYIPMHHTAPPHQSPAPSTPASIQAPAAVHEQPPQPAEEEEEIQEAPVKRARRTKERVRRIHLPVREGMDELSSSEGSGSEWDEPVLAEGQTLPPGYTGRRRVKKPADGKIKPAYYYPTEGHTRGVPVFEPTYEEFKDFNSFINKIDNYGMRSGIVKIVPPKEWHDSLVSVSQPLKDTIVRDAIEQNFMGSSGLFKQSNIASRRLYNVKQWKELCETSKYATPDFFKTEADKTRDRKAREDAAPIAKKPARGAATRAAKRAAAKAGVKEETPAPSVASEAPTMEDHETMKDQPAEQAPEDVKMDGKGAVIPTVAEYIPPSPATSTEQETQQQQQQQTSDQVPTASSIPATPAKESAVKAEEASAPTPGTAKSEQKAAGEMSNRKKRRAREEDMDNWDEEWEKFDYSSLPHGAKPEDYTVEECRKIEKYYWRNFTFGAPPMYGADGSGSLFDESNKEWNVAALDDLLMRINPHMPMPGVNTPYLYFGMWRATFSWHVEDADLYSINHLHFGAPKFWYSVPQAHAEHFERVMASYFQHDRQKCPEFLRHKSYLVSPQKLAKDGIPLNRVVQFPGEIILTYPYGYHSGFNIGFNCAESINFATEGWLDIGRKAEACTCVSDSVRIDVDKWLEEAREDAERIRSDPVYAEQRKQERELAVIIPQHEAKRRRIMGPDYVERKHRPAAQPRMQPKPSNAKSGKEFKDENVKPQNQSQGPAQTQARPPVAQGPSYAQIQAQIQANSNRPNVQGLSQVPKPVPVALDIKPVNSRPQAARSAPVSEYPCALCPEHSTEGLVRIANPGHKNKNKVLFAHKICVTFTPTTWVAHDPQTGEELVYGFELIEKERWNLKCGLCSDRHGTKIQCTKTAKCVRAFHTTCAIKEDSGVVLDALVSGRSVIDPNQDQQQQQLAVIDDGHLQLVVACRQHNPSWMKSQAEKRKNELSNRVASLPVGEQIQIRSTTGIYRVSVLGHRPEIAAVEIAFGDGTRALCKHGAIVWPEEAAKLQAEQGNMIAHNTPPRQHPMQRSRSGQNLAAQQQQVQAAHPFPQPPQQVHAPQSYQQYQNHQQPQQVQQNQQQYRVQPAYQAPSQSHAFPVPPQQHGQYQMPQVQPQYQQQYLPFQQQQPQYHNAPYQSSASPVQYSQHIQQQQMARQSPQMPQAPAQTAHVQPLGFVPQPIPYYNGKPVEIKAKARLPPTARP